MENKPFNSEEKTNPSFPTPPVQQQPYNPNQTYAPQPPRYTPPPYNSGYVPQTRSPYEFNIMEIIGLVLGALAIVSTFFHVYVEILGLIFGVSGVVISLLSKREKYSLLGIWAIIVSMFASGLIMFQLFQYILENVYHIYM